MAEVQAAAPSDREYETIFILKSGVTRDSSESISTRVAEVVARGGGKLTRVENWGRRRLAYPIAKEKRGVYVYVKYVGKGGLVSELERNLRMVDDVIKYQTVKVRDEVHLDAVVVAPEDVKFEHAEAPAEPEEEDSRARILGLEDTRPERESPPDRGGDSFDEDADGEFPDLGNEPPIGLEDDE
jgi:small subunit ribosomal protein S6